MAVPVIKGVKTAHERFAGALETFTIEAMMQDGKALQSGTSHFLGQNFAKAFDVKFINKENKLDYVWATSWGVSTRLMGALIMTHSDDNGLVLPPHLAPIQVVIVPIYRKQEQLAMVSEKVAGIVEALEGKRHQREIRRRRQQTPGIQIRRLRAGRVCLCASSSDRKDLEENTAEVMRRDTLGKETVSLDGIVDYVANLLEDIQNNIYTKARNFRDSHIFEANSYDEFKELIEKGGFVLAHWDGTTETEERVKEETKATIRCIPLDGDTTPGTCIFTGKRF